jgi:rod shape-determining protein MreD
MQTLLSALLIFVTLFVQTTVFDFFAFGGIKPDLSIVVIVYFALFQGISAAVGTGLIMGLLEDILSGGVLGVNMLTKSITGYLFSLVGRKIVIANPANHAIVVFLASLLNSGLFYFIIGLTPLTTPGNKIISRLILPQAAYNSLICLVLIPLLANLYKKKVVRG